MIKLKNIMVGSCRKATELIEKKSVFPLTMVESIKLYFHLKMCPTCTSYQKSTNEIDEGLKQLFEASKEERGHLSHSCKESIKDKINKK